MKITFDPPKRLATLDLRGMDMATLTEEFFLASVVVPAKDGRWMAIGFLADRAVAVVFAPLGTEAISIISMRPASVKERKLIR